MTDNPFAALLDGVRRYSYHDYDEDDGFCLREKDVLAALAAAVPADLAEAGKVLEEPQPRTLVIHHKTPCGCASARGSTGDCRTGIVRCNKCGKQIDRIEIVPNPDFDPTPLPDPKNVILARIAAQEAQINGLEAERDRFETALARCCLVGGQTYYMERIDLAERRAEAAETALAAERAKVAQLVEALKSCPPTSNPAVSAQEHLERINAWWRLTARAAITEAGQ